MPKDSFLFESIAKSLSTIEADWLIVPISKSEPLDHLLIDLDSFLGGDISKLISQGDFTGKAGETLAISTPRGIMASRILLVGLGEKAQLNRAGIQSSISIAFKSITSKLWQTVAVHVPSETLLSNETLILGIAAGIATGSTGPGLRKKEPNRHIPNQIQFVAGSELTRASKAIFERAIIEANAIKLAKELVNLPPDDLYPEIFASRASELSSRLSVEIWDEHRLLAERMGAVLAVSKGSTRPPRYIILKHQKGGHQSTLVLVGKGVTFDSGGLSLKTNDQMVDMKCDMAGAAAVFAAMDAISRLDLKINVEAHLPIVENMPGGLAMKLGDVLTARNGKTIEVLNTDAEGRLILADALALAAEKKPGHLVDLATLTGACLVALGSKIAGLMGNQSAWSDQVAGAIKHVGERAWPLPLDPDFEDLLKSKVADIKNAPGSRYGGAITAGKFLEQFVDGIPWVHLDIAGPAWADQDSPACEAGGTGAFVLSLIQLALTYQTF